MRKAELAVGKNDDELARAALERAMSFQQLTDSFEQQIGDQETQVEALKAALKKLELKLSEARGKADLLIAQHRRTRAVSRAADAQLTPTGEHHTLDRMQTKVAHAEAIGRAKGEILGDDIDGRLNALEREQKIDALLEEIKAKRKMLSA
jgi:phage shock protein A